MLCVVHLFRRKWYLFKHMAILYELHVSVLSLAYVYVVCPHSHLNLALS